MIYTLDQFHLVLDLYPNCKDDGFHIFCSQITQDFVGLKYFNFLIFSLHNFECNVYSRY